jgi:hypothetical protein
MKTLYESILSSTKSGKKSFVKSFSMNDISSFNKNLRFNAVIDVKEMKRVIKNKLNISIGKFEEEGRIFALYLTTIEFDPDEWNVIQNESSSKPDEVDKIFKEKLKDVLIQKFVKYYAFEIENKSLYAILKFQRIPDDLGVLIGDRHWVRFK